MDSGSVRTAEFQSGAGAPPRHQGALLALVERELAALDRALREQVSALTPAERRRVPSTGGWHVDAVCEHLCLANEQYLRTMTSAVEAALSRATGGRGVDDRAVRPAEQSGTPAWRPALAGRLLVHALVSPQRMPRPRVLTPGPDVRPHVLEALLASHDALREVLHRAHGLVWRRVRFSSPFARLVRLNLGDGALVILRHGERHLAQIARIRSATLS